VNPPSPNPERGIETPDEAVTSSKNVSPTPARRSVGPPVPPGMPDPSDPLEQAPARMAPSTRRIRKEGHFRIDIIINAELSTLLIGGGAETKLFGMQSAMRFDE
jgi:hypothetical protein